MNHYSNELKAMTVITLGKNNSSSKDMSVMSLIISNMMESNCGYSILLLAVAVLCADCAGL